MHPKTSLLDKSNHIVIETMNPHTQNHFISKENIENAQIHRKNLWPKKDFNKHGFPYFLSMFKNENK